MIRISQQMLFTNYVSNMNSSLSKLMELNIQASSQKRINKPSDDPAGMYRVLSHRDVLSSIEQYRSNISTATGWLKQADETILQMNTIVTSLKEMAEQGATGHLSADNREQISYAVREMYNQLINLANQRFEGKSIFAGHKTEGSAFEAAMWMRGNEHADLSGVNFKVEGDTARTAIVQMLDGDGTTPLAAGDEFRYSLDGGKTFSVPTAVVTDANGDFLLNMGSVRITIDSATPPTFKAVDPDDTNDTSGSWMWVYPTARYMGDDKDVIEVDAFGAKDAEGRSLLANASGVFDKNVLVRVDGYDAGSGTVSYSFSQDGGSTWKQNNTAPAGATDTSVLLTVPGGTLNISANADSTLIPPLTPPDDEVQNFLAAGQQFSIRPRTADITMDISPNESIVVNGVGKDIFGGIYKDPNDANPHLVFGDDRDKNLFDTVGRLLASLETNNQDGCQAALEHLRTVSTHLLNSVASYAGRENRLEVADNVLVNLRFNEEERLSHVEDVDIMSLMTKLAQQEIGYQAVLKSSASIMNLSLMNYI